MEWRDVFIVQDRASHLFLYPSQDGDVGYTPHLREAGYFFSADEAVECALETCDLPGFDVFQCRKLVTV
jgi:hypothetical protein